METIKSSMPKKNFLFISLDGLCSDMAWHVSQGGHDVKLYIDNPACKDIADGFVDKAESWQSEVAWADVIVFDDVLGQGKLAAELRAGGKAVLGGTEYTDMLEDDRSFGQRELKRLGVSIIPFEEFDNFQDAISYVKAHPAKYVIKPSGEAQNVKRSLFVGQEEDGKDVLQVLEAYSRIMADRIKVFQLQRRVDGVEVAVGAFFNGKQFIQPVNINFEHKKLFPGNIGPSTGEMGTSMYWSKPNKLFNQTLAKLESKLREVDYRGYIDLNCIVNHRGIYPLEFTSRFGFPTICIQQEGMLTPIAEVLAGIAEGSMTEFKTRSGFQVGVRILVPPYPFDDHDTFETYSKDAAILFKKPLLEGVHIEDVKRVDGQWLVAGDAGVALVIVGCGPTMRQAQTQAYARVKNVMIPNMYYRLDIGERWFEDSDRLHSWGYLREQ